MQAIYSLSPGDQYGLVRQHHITSHLQQATPCSRHDTGSKLARRCSSSRGKQPELATLAAWSPLQEPQNTSCVGRRWKRETAAPARAGRAARRPVAAQASLDPSFLWMVVAPSRCGTPVGGGAAVAQVADAAEARGATRGFAASRFSGNFGHFSLLLRLPQSALPVPGWAARPACLPPPPVPRPEPPFAPTLCWDLSRDSSFRFVFTPLHSKCMQTCRNVCAREV